MVRPTFGDRVHHELAIHTSRLVDTEAEVNISPKNHFFFYLLVQPIRFGQVDSLLYYIQ